jgi:hypothetical protein
LLAAQLLGAVGFIVMLIAARRRNRTALLALDAFGVALVSLHWVLLQEWAAAWLNSLYVAINVGAVAFVSERGSHRAYLALYPMAAAVVLVSFHGATDVLALAGTILAVLAKQTADLARLRALIIVSGLCWGLYGMLASSIPQVVFSAVFVATHAYELLRLRRHTGHRRACLGSDRDQMT